MLPVNDDYLLCVRAFVHIAIAQQNIDYNQKLNNKEWQASNDSDRAQHTQKKK